MNISSVGGGFGGANVVKGKDKENDNDKDDKAKATAQATAPQASDNAKNTGNVKPATPVAKSDQQDNVIQTKTPQASKPGSVDTVA